MHLKNGQASKSEDMLCLDEHQGFNLLNTYYYIFILLYICNIHKQKKFVTFKAIFFTKHQRLV